MKPAPLFLTISEVLEIHQDQIKRYGGSPGIRDLNLLKSALGMPAVSYGGEYLHQDIHEMAAAYLFHIVMNHPFIDGNKRTGTVAALVFFDINGFEFHATNHALEEAVLGVAGGLLDKAALTRFILKWATARQ